MILCLKVVAYTGKCFRENGLSDVDFFLPFGFGKGCGCLQFRGEPQSTDCPGGPLLAPRTSRIHLDFL